MEILNGKQTALKITQQLNKEIQQHLEDGKRPPRIDILLVGNDYASKMYVEMKSEKAKDLGIEVNINTFEESIKENDLKKLIDELNTDNNVDGIMIQLPLPKHIQVNSVLETISPLKDVDGLTSVNLGKLFKNDSSAIPPATPLGIMKLLEEYMIEILGKRVVILGTSKIVGIPLSAMMIKRRATVTMCNSKTIDIEGVSREADILISAVGKPNFVKRTFLKKGVVLIDVGSNKDSYTGKLVGDIDWNDVREIPSYITPVPGGVGPMTVISLMINLKNCYENRLD
jgi:methylenetetrahydrofolate dehydrogenase (NADP+) / methenyltetrahydrofolate cyclohydrolase